MVISTNIYVNGMGIAEMEICWRGRHNGLREVWKWLSHKILSRELSIITVKCEIEGKHEKVTMRYTKADMILL
jgi:hypothetical protein